MYKTTLLTRSYCEQVGTKCEDDGVSTWDTVNKVVGIRSVRKM